MAIFDRLRLPDVPGQPAMAQAAGEWFRDAVRAVFGSLDVGGVRRIADLFLLVPKKNSKTTNGAGLMLTALLMNRRPLAPFALFGPTQQISEIAYAAAAGMIEADEGLKALFKVQDHLKKVTMRTGPGAGASLKIMTFDPGVATGGKYAGWLLDEMHLLGHAPKAARVIAQLRGARTAVPEQFGVIITTQSDDRPAGAFAAELKYAREVRDGRHPDATLLPLLYEFPEDLQGAEGKPWRNPELWPMVLPNLGRSVNLDILRREHGVAVEKGAEEEALWASQHLNVEIGLALHSDRWAGADFWEAASEPALDLDALIAASDVVTAGIDGGGLDDLLGLAVIGRHRETKRWLHWGRAWAQPGVLEKRKEIAPRLRDFAADGDLVICEDPTQDIAELADIVERLWRAGLLPGKQGVGLDPYGIAALVDELAGRGIPDEVLVAVRQGAALSPAVWGLERKLQDGTFRHAGQRLMAWCVGNARVEQRGNAVLITKQTAGKAKIDPLIAAFDAAMLMARNPEASGAGATVADYFRALESVA